MKRGDTSAPNPFSGPSLPLAQLEAILAEVFDSLEQLPAKGPVDAMYLQAAQCRTGIAACRRHSFGPYVHQSLSAKVLRLETDVLVLRRSLGRPRPRAPHAR